MMMEWNEDDEKGSFSQSCWNSGQLALFLARYLLGFFLDLTLASALRNAFL